MAPSDVDPVVRSLANLRLQVSALETAAQQATMPEAMRQARRTVRGSALLVAVALVVSSVIRFWGDEHVRSLETRVERLEAEHDMRTR
jgi:hypothetical protein